MTRNDSSPASAAMLATSASIISKSNALSAAGRRIDVPPLGRRRHQHPPRDRTGLAQRLPRRADRGRAAGRLNAGQQRIPVELRVGRRMFQPHLFEIDFELFGDQHRDGRIGALAHLDIGHRQDDLPVGFDADEGIRREACGVGGFGFERQAQAQHEASACGCAGLQEAAAGETACRRRSVGARGRGNEGIEDHGQPPCRLDCAASLIASRIRT